MANSNNVQKLKDTNKTAVFKLTGFFDGTGEETNVLKIDTSTLTFAMNANNMIMSANTHPKPRYRAIPTRIWYDCNIKNGWLKLNFDSSSGDATILAVGRGQAQVDCTEAQVNRQEANSNGDIMLSTSGASGNDSYTIIVELRKDARDFDQGQTADPQAFNKLA